MDILGALSAFATLVLFLLYFIGKGVTIYLERNLKYITIDMYYPPDEFPENVKIVDTYMVGENPAETMLITPEKELNYIKIHEYLFDEKSTYFYKGRLLIQHNFLHANHSVEIKTYLPCSMPHYIIEFERYDFLRGELPLAENGKNGIIEQQVRLYHSWKSILYYLVK